MTPYEEGVAAYRAYLSRSDNPYPEDSDDAAAWLNGYNAAKNGDA